MSDAAPTSAAAAPAPASAAAAAAPRRPKLHRVRSSPEEEAAMIAGAEDSNKRARTGAAPAAAAAAAPATAADTNGAVRVPESALLASLPNTAAAANDTADTASAGKAPAAAAAASSGRRVIQLGSSTPAPALPFAPSTGRRGGRALASAVASSSGADATGCSLSISGFTRPVTASQIESLLRSFGETTALCVPPLTFNPAQVTYASPDSAAAALANLHKRRDWPQAGSRPLSARRCSDEEAKETIQRHQAKAGSAAATSTGGGRVPEERQTKHESARSREEAARLRAAQGVALYRARSIDTATAAVAPVAASSSASPSSSRSSRHVITLKNKRGGMTIGVTNDEAIDAEEGTVSVSRTVIRTRTFNDDDQDDARDESDNGAPAPTQTLDDLFRKTAFLPALYWLPCTQQEIDEKTRKLAERRRSSGSRSRSRSRSRSPRR